MRSAVRPGSVVAKPLVGAAAPADAAAEAGGPGRPAPNAQFMLPPFESHEVPEFDFCRGPAQGGVRGSGDPAPDGAVAEAPETRPSPIVAPSPPADAGGSPVRDVRE